MPITRRSFAASLAAAGAARGAAPRPNILWITCEDIGPQLRACGDEYSVTPQLDRLAARGQIYMNAWSNAPVCAPARTTIISGMYAPSTGGEHMRSMVPLPTGFKMFPQFLREAGYYCSNNNKEDYNLVKPPGVWDDSSTNGHWRNRAKGQPFFSIFNILDTHEGQIRSRKLTGVHDPAKVRVPAYHPDTPEVRRDWAQYYDNITTMDGKAGKILADLEADGLASDTIVFFYGDHGSGMPRSKRYPYNSGLNVSIYVAFPEKWRHLAPPGYKAGTKSDRLVGFVDLAPTVLSLAGIQAAPYHQGQAFLGQYAKPERPFNYGFRGRMDERYDMMRTVRDKRYVYIRNYMPHRIYGQHVGYMFETPTTRIWKKLYDEGKLKPPQTYFWETKPPEELYDLQTDRDETRNLAAQPAHRATLERLRQAQRGLAAQVRDVGFLPEGEILSRSRGSSPYEMGHDDARYPMRKIAAAAEAAASTEPLPPALFTDQDSAVRYWAATGSLIRRTVPRALLADPSPYVRVAAAEALGRYGSEADVKKAVAMLAELAPPDKNGAFVSMMALNALDYIGAKAKSALPVIESMAQEDKNVEARYRGYCARVIEKLLADWKS